MGKAKAKWRIQIKEWISYAYEQRSCLFLVHFLFKGGRRTKKKKKQKLYESIMLVIISSISILKSLKTKTCWKCSRLQEIALRTPFSIWLDFDRVLTSAAHNSYKRCFFFLCNVNIILYTYRFDWPWYWTKLHTLSRWYSTMFFFSLLFIISTARHEPPIISDSISYVLWTSTEMSLFRKKTHTILEIQLDAKQTKETQLTLLLTFSRRLGSAICFSGCAKSLVAI